MLFRSCADCRGEVSRLERLRALLRSAFTAGPDPDWAGFWDGVRRRIGTERLWPWREAWGWYPRLALAGALAGVLLVGILLWQFAPTEEPAPTAGVVVNTVETAPPNGNVMVFSSPEDDMTVIWILGLDRTPGDETRVVPVSATGNRG